MCVYCVSCVSLQAASVAMNDEQSWYMLIHAWLHTVAVKSTDMFKRDYAYSWLSEKEKAKVKHYFPGKKQ